jgi:membrane protein implicated in regulation of membrane protease activity
MTIVDYNLPFAIAFGLLFLITVAQVVGLGDLIGGHDAHVDLHHGDLGHVDAMDGISSLLGIGRVPFLVWLSLLLLMFSGLGVTGQFLLSLLGSSMMTPGLASAIVALPALILTSLSARLLEPIMPKDETTAVSVSELVGKRGTVSIGAARRGYPARVQVKDHFGQPHNVMVEPHDDGAEFLEGDEVLLVRLDNGLFYGISTSDRRLGPVE